jgi:deoxycytidylate deaminase
LSKKSFHKKVTDKTCCVHAEQRAIMAALQSFPEMIIDSVLYFMQVDEQGEQLPVDRPYLDLCSSMILDAEISGIVLLHSDGIYYYDVVAYNDLCFGYK